MNGHPWKAAARSLAMRLALLAVVCTAGVGVALTFTPSPAAGVADDKHRGLHSEKGWGCFFEGCDPGDPHPGQICCS